MVNLIVKPLDDKKTINISTSGILPLWRISSSALIFVSLFSKPWGLGRLNRFYDLSFIEQYDTHHLVSTSIFILLLIYALLLFPTYNMYLILKNIKITSIKEALTLLGAIAILTIGTLAMHFIDSWLGPSGRRVVGILFISFSVISLGYICIQFYRDFIIYKRIEINLIKSRPFISDSLIAFKTEHYKLKFIKLIQTSFDKCTGDWPRGRIPDENSEVATLLARLEEKWLGLDR
jgi:hypothetical protein